jgi:two-component system capsular synthesis response regulator RcsB
MKNSKFSIFILDDSKIITEIMKQVISTVPGVSVSAFRNSASFMEQFSAESPELIFLDYYLDSDNKKELTGEEIFMEIKQKNPQLPVVLLTGINDPNKLSHFKEIGFSEVLNKDEPEIFNQILICVNKFTS